MPEIPWWQLNLEHPDFKLRAIVVSFPEEEMLIV